MLTLIKAEDLYNGMLEEFQLTYDVEDQIYQDGFTGADEFERRVGHLPWIIGTLEAGLASPMYSVLGIINTNSCSV